MTPDDPADSPTATTEDALLDGRVRLRQPVRGYRVAVDPVLLAAAVPATPAETVLELGCGVGAASLCLATRVAGCRVTGLEVQPGMAELARVNTIANGLADRVKIVTGDLRAPPEPLPSRRFDRVMMNPPFYADGRHTPSPVPAKAMSHGEGDAGLDDWIQASLRQLTARGVLTLIHGADRLDELLALLHGRFGGIVMFPLWPRAGQPAKRVIVQARRNVRSPLRLAPGLVLHGPDGAYTAEAERVLRHGDALVL